MLGILSVNIVLFAMHQTAYMNPAALGPPSVADLAVWAANLVFVDGKFRTLFSMLFGASALLVIERADAAGERGRATHLRRMVVLLILGLAHTILLWRGDILTLYAMAGLVLTLVVRKPTEKLLAWAILLLVMHVALFAAITATLVHQDQLVHSGGASAEMVRDWNSNASSFFPSAASVASDRATYDSDWGAIVAHEIGQLGEIMANNVALMADTLGLMLLGMVGYRSGFLTGEWDDAAYRRVAAWGIGVGVAAHAALAIADIATGFYIPLVLGGFVAAMAPFQLAQAAGYAALLVLWSRRPSALGERVAAVGRAALSNYILSSLVCTAIFYGWGLGLYGDLGRAQAWLVVPLVWAIMLAWSKPWLERFRYGPVEWLWRSLARGRVQPMRR